MARQRPHFHHHVVELQRTRRRFSASLAAIFAVATIIAGYQIAASHAAATTQMDGVKIDTSGVGTYGGSTSGPYASATVSKTSLPASTTANPFYFSLNPPSGGGTYTFSVSPTTIGNYHLKGYTYELGSQVGWNAQTTNFHAGSSLTLTINPGEHYHMRWIYQYVAPPTPTPTPAPTPKPTVAPTNPPVHTPTPKPTVKPTTPGSTAVPLPPDTAPPTTPTSFQALASGDNAVVALSWAPSSDDRGVAVYTLDRSVDQTNWSPISSTLTSTNYQDDSAAFGVHYYYRLRALDAAVNASDYAYADAITAEFAPNTDVSADTSYTSTDKLATATLPSGALTGSAVCSVETVDGTVDVPSGYAVLGGPYQLVCKDVGGDPIVKFSKPIEWSYTLKDKLKGYQTPKGASLDSQGKTTVLKNATFASKAGILQFQLASADSTMAIAAAKKPLPWNLIAIIILVLLIVGGIIVFILRRRQKQTYDDYLRSKYYNI